jgi:hypothetical protein
MSGPLICYAFCYQAFLLAFSDSPVFKWLLLLGGGHAEKKFC